MTPHVPGWHTLCPSRWTKRAASLESILQNYPTLFATGEEAAEVAKQPDVKARINGVAAQMKEFKFFYCLMLAERLLNLSVLYALDYCYLLLLIIIGFIFGTARLRYYSCLAPVKLYA